MGRTFSPPTIRALIIGALVFATAALAVQQLPAQQNPFFSDGSADASGERQSGAGQAGTDSADTETWRGADSRDGSQPRRGDSNTLKRLRIGGFDALARVQRGLYESITGTVESLSSDPSLVVVASLFGIMFLYGFLHAVGPGHRKVVLTSYFLNESIRPLPGVLMAGGVALLHGVSAIVLIGSLYFALDRTIGGSFNAASLLIERISYGILVLLGAYLIVHTLRDGRRPGNNPENSTDSPVSGTPRPRRRRGLAGKIVFVLTNGIVPCPGAAMVLVFSFSFGLYALGVFSVLAMSIGMGVLLALVSAVVLVGKEKGLKRVLAGRKGKTALRVLEIAGGAAVGLFGLMLLLGSL